VHTTTCLCFINCFSILYTGTVVKNFIPPGLDCELGQYYGYYITLFVIVTSADSINFNRGSTTFLKGEYFTISTISVSILSNLSLTFCPVLRRWNIKSNYIVRYCLAYLKALTLALLMLSIGTITLFLYTSLVMFIEDSSSGLILNCLDTAT